MTKINNEETIEKVTGGTNKMTELKNSLADMIGEDVMKKLENVYSDVEVCKILAENGIDLEKVEKRIAEAGLNMNRIGLQLPDDNLSEISGGFYDKDQNDDIDCPNCGNDVRDDFSRQWFASLTSPAESIYRCKKCGMFTAVMGKDMVIYSDFNLDVLVDHLKKL